jgi:hypothetical protein
VIRRLLARLGYVPTPCAHARLVSTHKGAEVRADGEVWLDLTIKCDACPWAGVSDFSTGIKVLHDDGKKPVARA